MLPASRSRRPTWLTTAADALVAALLAPHCAACDAPLDTPTRSPVCTPCWQAVRPVPPPLCATCGVPLPSWRLHAVDEARCPRCRRTTPLVVRAGAAGLYEGRLRDLVHALKYKRRVSLARPLALLMRERGAAVLEGADLVVPVPLHWQRRRERGFNQAVLLARHLGRPLVEALSRARPTPPQASLGRAKRHANVRDAFVAARPFWRGRDWARHAVAGRVVVIVDDVCTTGATLDACARVLVRLGAAEVRALTAARVALGPPPPPPG